MPRHISQELSDILAQERAALLAGDFDRVTTLADQKLAMLEGLSDSSLTAEALAMTRNEVLRNQELYQSAISGITSARARLDELAHVRDGLSVYDQTGTVSKVATARPDVERKA